MIHATIINDVLVVSVSGHVHGLDCKAFQELVQRGANLWPDAPPSIKEFADIVTNGKAMQDYSKATTTNQPSLAQQHVNSGD